MTDSQQQQQQHLLLTIDLIGKDGGGRPTANFAAALAERSAESARNPPKSLLNLPLLLHFAPISPNSFSALYWADDWRPKTGD